VRVIYFAMLPTGVLNDTNVVVYIVLGDLPVYLFLSIYTLLIFFWYRVPLPSHVRVVSRVVGRVVSCRVACHMVVCRVGLVALVMCVRANGIVSWPCGDRVELVHWTLKTGGKTMLKRMKLMFLFVNAFIYLFLLALIIIFITLQANTSTTDVPTAPFSHQPTCPHQLTVLCVSCAVVRVRVCRQQTSCSTDYYLSGSDPNQDLKDARRGLAIFYQTVIIFIALCLAIAFIIYGSVVIWMLARIKSMSKKLASMKRKKMIKVRCTSMCA
jgi:small-conductance mechanosensitive channel